MSLFHGLAEARRQSGTTLAQRPLVHLAPMVRAGTLALRALCIDYGADLVWSEEIIDRKLVRCTRQENKVLGTIDFVIPAEQFRGDVLLFRTHACEHGRVILQLGTSSAVGALNAARIVEADVAGIDINMGCPKKFSVDNGMGAALLADQDRGMDIVRTLKQNLSIPVTVKVRLLETMELTIALLKNLQAAGADAVTVHLRRPGDGESTPAREFSTMKELVDAVPGLPLLINGDMYTMQRVRDMVDGSGCAGAMLARPILLNPSVIRTEGFLPQVTVMKALLRHCLRFDVIYQLAKYTLMEMMVMRRHPPAVVTALRALPTGQVPPHGRLDGYWEPVQCSKSLKDICITFGMRDEYDAIYDNDNATQPKKEGVIGLVLGEPKVKQPKQVKKRKEADALQHPSKIDDAYFQTETAAEHVNVSASEEHAAKRIATSATANGTTTIKTPSTNAIVNGSSVEFRVATDADIESIVAVTNDAYVADEFFKLPAYYLRFTSQQVKEMIAAKGVFLLACAPGQPHTICGSCYLECSSTITNGNIHVTGNFGAVAVARAYEKKGIGAALIRAAESHVLTTATYAKSQAQTLSQAPQEGTELPTYTTTASIEMGVINLRNDLFSWYGRMGFTRGEEMRPNNAELTRICLPHLDVCCVRMFKNLS